MGIILKQNLDPADQQTILEDGDVHGSMTYQDFAKEHSHINFDGLSLIGITLAIFVVAILARPLLGVTAFLIKYIILFAIIFGLVSYYGII